MRDSQTHCKQGHEFTEKNTAFAKNGTRRCRECHRLREAVRRALNPPPRIPRSPARPLSPSRVLDGVAQSGSGCWEWTGALTNGYGTVKHQGVSMGAHRYAYLAFVGPIPDGLDLDHRCHSEDLACMGGAGCRHRRCVNPAHLEPVTRGENSRRGRAGAVNGGRKLANTACPQGHPYDEGNTVRERNEGHRRCLICRTKQRAEAAARRLEREKSERAAARASRRAGVA